MLARQTTSWNALGELMHCSAHCAGPVPPEMQPKKQTTSSMQLGSCWHVRDCEQQLCAAQSLHGVPSDGQTELPQTPALHTPLQHCVAAPHIAPSGWHTPPQTLLPQKALQHCEGFVQNDPSG